MAVSSVNASAHQYECPINLTPMDDPMRVIPCGHTFNRDAIEDWLKRSHTCPLDRREVERIEPNLELQEKIQEVAEKNIEHAQAPSPVASQEQAPVLAQSSSDPGDAMIQEGEAPLLLGEEKEGKLRFFERCMDLTPGILSLAPSCLHVREMVKSGVPYVQYTGYLINSVYGSRRGNWQVLLRNDGYLGFELSQIY